MPSPSQIATPQETLLELLRVSGSGYTKVRHLLVQLPDDVKDRIGLLGPMVTDRKRRALQLYLLLLTVWPWLQNRDEPLPSTVWARALSTETGRKWTASTVSTAWTDLEERGLIARRRLAHGVIVAPRREDAKADYTSPGLIKKDHRESYFVLPPELWTDGWFERLTLPGLAMLLVVASQTNEEPEKWLTNTDAAEWFGMSPRSVEGGLADLAKHGLLTERVEWVKAPLSAIGSTKRHYYGLTGPFSTEARKAMQEETAAAVAKRTAPAKAAKKKTGKSKKTSKSAKTKITYNKPVTTEAKLTGQKTKGVEA